MDDLALLEALGIRVREVDDLIEGGLWVADARLLLLDRTVTPADRDRHLRDVLERMRRQGWADPVTSSRPSTPPTAVSAPAGRVRSTTEVAEVLRCSPEFVRKTAKKHGIGYLIGGRNGFMFTDEDIAGLREVLAPKPPQTPRRRRRRRV